MNDGQIVYDDVVERVLNLMRNNFGTYFRSFYDGDIIEIPKANLPCVIVEKIATEVRQDATATDVVESELILTLALNREEDSNINDDVDTTHKKLRNLTEGRDTNGMYLENTVMYALRKNITMGNAVISANTGVNYDIVPRTSAVTTSEARISITTRERVIVGTRL